MSELLLVEVLMTPEAYLEAEETSEVRHEYLGGRVYAMSGASLAHGRIVGNLDRLLGQHLDGSPCEVFVAEVRLRAATDVFYCPDLMVCCDSGEDQARYAEHPRVVIEVASPSTQRIDEREKAFAYWLVPSIETYVLVDQDSLLVRVLRRGETTWESEILSRLDDQLRLESLAFSAPLSAIYVRTQVGRAT